MSAAPLVTKDDLPPSKRNRVVHTGMQTRSKKTPPPIDNTEDPVADAVEAVAHDLARGHPIAPLLEPSPETDIHPRRVAKKIRARTIGDQKSRDKPNKTKKKRNHQKGPKSDVVGPDSPGMYRIQRLVAYLEDTVKDPKIVTDHMDHLAVSVYACSLRHEKGDKHYLHLPGSIFEEVVQRIGGPIFGVYFKKSATHPRVKPLSEILKRGRFLVSRTVKEREATAAAAAAEEEGSTSSSDQASCFEDDLSLSLGSQLTKAMGNGLLINPVVNIGSGSKTPSPLPENGDFVAFFPDTDIFEEEEDVLEDLLVQPLHQQVAENAATTKKNAVDRMNRNPSMIQLSLVYGMYHYCTQGGEIDMASILEASELLKDLGEQQRRELWASLWNVPSQNSAEV